MGYPYNRNYVDEHAAYAESLGDEERRQLKETMTSSSKQPTLSRPTCTRARCNLRGMEMISEGDHWCGAWHWRCPWCYGTAKATADEINQFKFIDGKEEKAMPPPRRQCGQRKGFFVHQEGDVILRWHAESHLYYWSCRQCAEQMISPPPTHEEILAYALIDCGETTYAKYNAWHAWHPAVEIDKKEKEEEKKENIAMITEKKTKMTTPDLTETLKANMAEAAWRSAADTTVQLVRKPLAATLANRLPDSPQAQAVAVFLQTREGEAFLALMLGFSPLFVPQLNADPRIAKLAEEMRVEGLRVVSDRVLKDLAGPILEAFTTAVTGLPPLPVKTTANE